MQSHLQHSRLKHKAVQVSVRRLNERTYSDFVVDEPVVCVLVKLLLGIHVDAIGPQLLPNLRGGDGPL